MDVDSTINPENNIFWKVNLLKNHLEHKIVELHHTSRTLSKIRESEDTKITKTKVPIAKHLNRPFIFSWQQQLFMFAFDKTQKKQYIQINLMGNSCTECLTISIQQRIKKGEDELKGIQWVQEVKRGSISTVWLVKKKESQKEYVMKVTDKLKLVDRGDVCSIMTEKNIMEAINSPFLVNFVTSFQDKEKLYILMEYMPHGNLRQLLNKATLSESQIRFIILCLLFGLTHMHHQKILHLDLKPENIVIDDDKYARICDFGLSKFLNSKPKKKLLGTFGYQAPELFAASDSGNKELLKKQVDYYSLGVIGCQMLLGNTFRVRDGVNKEKMRDLLWGKASTECVDFLLQLIQPDPKKRLGSNRTKQIWKHPWIKVSSQQLKQYKKKKVISPLVQEQFSRIRAQRDAKNDLDNSDESYDEIYCNLLFKQANFQKMFVGFEPEKRNIKYLAK